MTPEAFERLAARAEGLAARSPGTYRLRVAALGALGYLYVWALLLVALGLVVLVGGGAIEAGTENIPGVLVVKVLIPLFAFVGILLKALWVRIPPPGGIPLPRRDFPELHETLDRIRSSLRGPRLHAVLLDDELNASITQVPRLGIFGWHRNYLVLGLPLLLGLSRGEVEAVLAHEFGHLSGSDGKVGAWIYRIRMTWMRLMLAFDKRRGAGSALVRRFFDWYAPYFQAYSFALARANEYAADRAAAAFAGTERAAGALVRLALLAPYLEEAYWPRLRARAEDSPVPPAETFTDMARVAVSSGEAMSGERLAAALGAHTDHSDTHPSLTDRLAALGVEPGLPEAGVEPAADSLLGAKAAEMVRTLDARWKGQAAPWYEKRYEHVQASRARLEALDAAGPEVGVDGMLERAAIVEDMEGRAAALPVYRKVLELDPDQALASCIVGLDALSAGDPAGEDMIEAAMRRDPDLALGGLQALRDHYAGAGEREKALAFQQRFMERYQEVERIQAERRRIPFKDVYDPPDLPEASVVAVMKALDGVPWLRRAYLVRKRVELSSAPCYLLALEARPRFTLRDDRARLCRSVAERLEVPEEIFVLVLGRDSAQLKGIVRKVDGARLV